MIRLATPRQIPTRPILKKMIQNDCFSYWKWMIWPISFKSHFCRFLTKLSNCFGSYVQACCTIDLKNSHKIYLAILFFMKLIRYLLFTKKIIFLFFSYVESKCKISYNEKMLILHCFHDWNQLIRLATSRQIPTRPILKKMI